MSTNNNNEDINNYMLNSQPPLKKNLTPSQLRQQLYPNSNQLFKAKPALFRQIHKPRKITNPKERGEKEEEPSSSSFSSSSSSSSSSLQNFNFIPRQPMSDFEKQFHPLLTPVDGSPLEAIIDMNIMKRGRIINTPLTASEAEFYAEQKDTFEVLHNKIPKDQYRAIQERARMNINNVFSDLEIAKVDKRLPGDARGAALQRHAITLAREDDGPEMY
jgi:hypothetical protein